MKAKTNILVVDDEQAHTLLLAELLKNAGYNVAVANDGFKALAACRVRTPDLIVLDLHMPLMGGIEVLNRLRADEKTRSVPLIFMGNKNQANPKFIDEDAEDEDILLKPFEANELLSRVKTALRQRALVEQLKATEGQLRELAITDPVTSLKSARFLKEFLATTIKQSRRYQVPLSVIIMNLDHSKEMHQQLGPSGSEELLVQIGQYVGGHLRDSDIVARTGPFELTLVLTLTDDKGAIEVAERLRTRIKESPFTAQGSSLTLTASLGLCQFAESMDDHGKVLLSHAHAALDEAQSGGGDVTLMAE